MHFSYKIVHGHIAVPTDDILVTVDNRTRSDHQYKYRYMPASTTEYKNSFFPKTIKEWNNCSVDLIESSSLDVFKKITCSTQRAPMLIAWSCWKPSA